MTPLRPHWGWFLLAPAFLVVGILVAVVLVVGTVGSSDTNRVKVPVPGEGTFVFEKPGTRSIIFEQTGTSRAQAPSDLQVTVIQEGEGEPLAIRPSNTSFYYSSGGVAGVSIAEVDIPRPGRYRVQTSLSGLYGRPMGSAVVVGNNPVGGILGAAFGSLAAIGFGFVAGVVVVVVVLVKRSNYRKQIMAQQYPQGPYPPHGPYPPPPGARPSF